MSNTMHSNDMSKAFGSGIMASRATMIIDREILTVLAGVLLFLLS